MNHKPRFEQYPLGSRDVPRYFYSYYATGSGEFPYDMLRFDACWPASPSDAAKLEPTWVQNAYKTGRQQRTVKLHSYKEPTPERWSSFLWSVGNEELVK